VIGDTGMLWTCVRAPHDLTDDDYDPFQPLTPPPRGRRYHYVSVADQHLMRHLPT
jgi:hypothetical protein